MLFEQLDFLAELTAVVAKPRVNPTRFHRVYAPNSKSRTQVTLAKRDKGGDRDWVLSPRIRRLPRRMPPFFLPNSHCADAVPGHRGGIHQIIADGKGAYRRGEVAAVSGPVHKGLADGNLPEEVIHVVIRAFATRQDHGFGCAGGEGNLDLGSKGYAENRKQLQFFCWSADLDDAAEISAKRAPIRMNRRLGSW